MKYFFEYPANEVGFPPLFGASRYQLVDSYQEGIDQILGWVLIEDPEMGGVSVQGAVEELRRLLGEIKIRTRFTSAFPQWESDFTHLCQLWWQISDLYREAVEDYGVLPLSLDSQLFAARDLLKEGEVEKAGDLLVIARENLNQR